MLPLTFIPSKQMVLYNLHVISLKMYIYLEVIKDTDQTKIHIHNNMCNYDI